MTSVAVKRGFQVAVHITPEWSNISALRTALQALLTMVLQGDAVRAAEMATSELAENAIKFGGWKSGEDSLLTLSVALREDGSGSFLDIEIANPVDESGAHYENLLNRLKWIEGHASPREAYLARVKEIEAAADTPAESGLGLVRIASEGQCQITVRRQDNTVFVKASVPSAV